MFSITAGQLRSIKEGKGFHFNVKEGDQAYNQMHYQALGEVWCLSSLHLLYFLITIFHLLYASFWRHWLSMEFSNDLSIVFCHCFHVEWGAGKLIKYNQLVIFTLLEQVWPLMLIFEYMYCLLLCIMNVISPIDCWLQFLNANILLIWQVYEIIFIKQRDTISKLVTFLIYRITVCFSCWQRRCTTC